MNKEIKKTILLNLLIGMLKPNACHGEPVEPWIPAGVYPRENGGGYDGKKETENKIASAAPRNDKI